MPSFHLNGIKENYPDSDAGELLVIPVIKRCSEFRNKNEEGYSFSLCKIIDKDDDITEMNISWNGIGPVAPESALEDKNITELAALGIAHIIFPEIINKRILGRTQFGDRADYWVGEEDKESLLEVSGMYKNREKIEKRVDKKEHQLIQSPFYNGEFDNVDGYVSITHFDKNSSVIKYVPERSR